MTAVSWVSLATPGLAVAGGILAAAVKLDRLTNAVERLDSSMRRIAGKIEDHEIRLTRGGL